MMFLKSLAPPAEHEVYTAEARLAGRPGEVLAALTEPALIARWAPVDFDVEGLAGGRLRTGSRERVSGAMAGIRATFDVEVVAADERRLELVARGPVSFDVAYRFACSDDGVRVRARVSLLPPGGLAARVLRGAAAALLRAGALERALSRIGASLGNTGESELLAA